MSERKGMTNRERMEALLLRRKPDRVPILPIVSGFCDLYAGGSVAEAYNNPAAFLSAQSKASEDFDWIFYPLMLFPTALAAEFGGDFKYPEGDFAQASMITRHPVDTEEDVWNLKMPDVKTAGNSLMRMEYCKLSSQERLENEPFNIMLWYAPFTGAAQIPGVEKFCRWIVKKPEAAHRLLRLSTDFYLEQAKYWKETFGTEGVLPFCGEPTTSNQIISPKQFEKFAMPYIKELSEEMLALGYKHIYMHVCGEQNLNLPYWGQIPAGDPGIISIGHEVELETAARHFPNEIIMGNLEPAVIQTGTPEEVYEATRKVVEKGKKLPTGFIFSPGCEVPPRAKVENVMAMTRAVNDFGWYE